MDLDIDLDGTSLFEEADKSKVPPIFQKRIIAFVNHFLLKTCSFLNDFVEECEIRFIETERKMQKLEATLIILEEKLASIPDIETNQKIVPEIDNCSQPLVEEDSNKTSDEKELQGTSNPEESVNTQVDIKANEDVRYRKYFKMLQFGVPIPAVKSKMEIDGFDPDILDTPNLILSDGIPYKQQGDS
ncbi:WASH complex subunit 3 [Condylostylus longicornis]|uniref:WASH complex subunit 3 n=1 Tax=Condylostylus longicornis TaxID=2530218 RepID=UPI00244DD9B4|nr:WASH complex subunit 3 [Condylostylus longicornis]